MHRARTARKAIGKGTAPNERSVRHDLERTIEVTEDRLRRLKRSLAALNDEPLEDVDLAAEAEPSRSDLIAEWLSGRKRRIGSLRDWLHEEHGEEVSKEELSVLLKRDGRFTRLAKGWWTLAENGGESS